MSELMRALRSEAMRPARRRIEQAEAVIDAAIEWDTLFQQLPDVAAALEFEEAAALWQRFMAAEEKLARAVAEYKG